jgi:endoglucanase
MLPNNQPTEPLTPPTKTLTAHPGGSQPPKPGSRRSRYILLAGLLIVILGTVIGVAAALWSKAVNPTPATGKLGQGPWHTDKAQILDANNQPVRIAGANWFGFETTSFAVHGLQNRDYKDMINQIKSMGYNTIRLPYSNQLFDKNSVPHDIDYGKNPDLQGLQGLQLMDKIVDYATSNGLHIILDQHRPDANGQSALWYTSAYPEARWISDWQMLASHYKDNTMIIGADLHNEPRSPACWGCGKQDVDWKSAAERGGNAILATNPNWLIFVEGVDCYGATQGNDCYWWGGNLQGVKSAPVQLNVANKLVYSVHDYPASLVEHAWFKAADYPQNLPAVWDKYWGYVKKEGIAPVLVGEFGSKLATASDKQWFSSMINYLGTGASGFNWTYWGWTPDSNDTGGLLKDDWQTINQDKQDQLKAIQFALGGTTQANTTPIATTAVTPTPASAKGAVTISYQNGNQNTSVNQLQPALQLTNTGSSPISLTDVTIRYWYTADSQQAQEITCDYATVDCKNVAYKLVKMSPARTGADTYMEVSFTGGTLAAGTNSEVKLRVHRSDWSNYNQSNDYSFVAGASNYSATQKIGVYEQGKLISGSEPA